MIDPPTPPIGHMWDYAGSKWRLLDATRRIVAEASPHVNETFASVEGKSIGSYADSHSAMKAIVASVGDKLKGKPDA